MRDPQILAKMTVIAQALANDAPNYIIRLIEFSTRTDVKDLMPEPKPGPRT